MYIVQYIGTCTFMCRRCLLLYSTCFFFQCSHVMSWSLPSNICMHAQYNNICSCWGMEVIVHYNIVCINRDTMTRVMSLPIKTVMEYKAHNISLKYEYPNTRHVFNNCVHVGARLMKLLYFVHRDRSSYRNTDVFVR